MIKVLGIKIIDRIKEAGLTQGILSKNASVITTRLGFHEVTDEVCSREAYIILHLNGDHADTDKLAFELKKLESGTIPFVIEGFLFDSKKKKSISVKHFNGEYIITEFVDEKLDNIRFIGEHSFPAYKLDGIKYVKRIKMQELIPLENGFAVWQNVADVFVGFEK